MEQTYFEKRRYPRVDTSREQQCRITIYSVKGKAIEENQVMNLSLGGVAFLGSFQNIIQTLKRVTTRVEIKLPNGARVGAETTLLRVKPKSHPEDCLCVFELTDINKKNSTRLARFFPA